MKNIGLGTFLIGITVLAIIFNLNDFIFGGKVPLYDFLLSFSYGTIWVLVFRYALNIGEHSLILSSTVFWCLTCLTALITLYINITEATISFMIPFAIVFLTPLYGMNFIGTHNIITLAIILTFACYFICFGARYIIRNKKQMKF